MFLNININVYNDHVRVTSFSAQEKMTKVERIIIYLHGNIQMLTKYRKRKYLESRARQSQRA